MTLHSDPIAPLLGQVGACREAVEWAGTRTIAQAWAECPRGDWMLWLLARLDADRQRIVRAACQCARLALPYVPSDELRPLAAIETAEAWTRGEATLVQVNAAAAAAYAAAYAAYAYAYDAYTYAYDAAAAAAAAAYDAYTYAYDAADAAAYAADAADAAAYAARTSTLARCADLVRVEFPELPLAEGGAA